MALRLGWKYSAQRRNDPPPPSRSARHQAQALIRTLAKQSRPERGARSRPRRSLTTARTQSHSNIYGECGRAKRCNSSWTRYSVCHTPSKPSSYSECSNCSYNKSTSRARDPLSSGLHFHPPQRRRLHPSRHRRDFGQAGLVVRLQCWSPLQAGSCRNHPFSSQSDGVTNTPAQATHPPLPSPLSILEIHRLPRRRSRLEASGAIAPALATCPILVRPQRYIPSARRAPRLFPHRPHRHRHSITRDLVRHGQQHRTRSRSPHPQSLSRRI